MPVGSRSIKTKGSACTHSVNRRKRKYSPRVREREVKQTCSDQDDVICMGKKEVEKQGNIIESCERVIACAIREHMVCVDMYS